MNRERAALAGQLRAAYMIGREEPLKLLLNQQDPLHSAACSPITAISAARVPEQIAQIQTHVQRLDELDAELGQQQTQLASLKAAQQSQLQQLEHARNERQTGAGQSRRRGAHARAEPGAPEEPAGRSRAPAEGTEPLAQDGTAAGQRDRLRSLARSAGLAGGRPASRRSSATPRASGVNWEGVVIATERGAPVSAVAAGRVVYADWLPGLGLLAIVDHGEGYMSLYGHNDRLLKAVGEPVAAGEVIAAAGDTGGRASPELYFEIRRGGKPVDPAPWFRARTVPTPPRP